MALTLLGGLALGLLLLESCRQSLRIARRLGSIALAPAIWECLAGLAVFLVTETLSLGQLLAPRVILAVWLAVLVASWSSGGWAALRGVDLESTPLPLNGVRIEIRLAVVALAVVLLGTLVTAIASPPNNWDSLIYHNPRVMQWLDHASVAFYSTPIDRQLRMPPLASYFRLHLFALTGSDELFNLVEWLFFGLVILECALLVRALRGGASQAALAAVFAATLPAAVLQSSGTQNDVVASSYVLSALLMLAHRLRSSSPSPSLVLLIGVLIGLGALVKGTDYIVGALALLATLSVLLLRGDSTRRELLVALGGIALAVALNLPHLARNRSYFGSAMPHPEAVAFRTWLSEPPALSLKRAGSQILRSAALQCDLLERPEEPGEILDRALEAVHSGMGLSLADPRITLVPTARILRSRRVESDKPAFRVPLDEDIAGNTLQFLLGLGVAGACLVSPALRRRKEVTLLLFFAAVAWVALAVAIKWMPWNSRLQLPALVLLAAPVGLAVGARSRVALTMVVVLFTASLPYVLLNASRPLLALPGSPSVFQVSRWENLFRGRPQLRKPVEKILAELPKTCSRTRPVGLRIGPDEWEYPFWVGARNAGRSLSFRHVSASVPDSSLCAVISDDCAEGPFCLEPRAGPPGL